MEIDAIDPVTESLEKVQFLSVIQVMKLLKISRSTLHSLILRKSNPLPSVKIGKSRRFPFNKVRVWMENLGC